MILKDSARQQFKNALHDAVGLNLTDAQLDAVTSDPRVHRELDLGGVHDTLTVEIAADFLARVVLGRDWPTYGDGPNDKFIKDFEEAARKLGYAIA